MELRQIVTDEVARLQRRDEEVWEAVEKPQLQDWHSGVDMDLGPDVGFGNRSGSRSQVLSDMIGSRRATGVS